MAPAESVVVVMDANRRKVNVDALDWAIKHAVRPRDLVVVLGVLSEVGKKTSSSSSSSSSCLPFHMGNTFSRILRIEFSGHGEMSPTELEEEIEKKREEYHCAFHPFYRCCKKNEVKLEVILAAGYDPSEKTIEQAQNYNPSWIVLDSHLKKHKAYIHGHVSCNVAVMKGKDFATLLSARTPEYKQLPTDWESNSNEQERLQGEDLNVLPEKTLIPATTPQSPCWYPLSWRTGFPRAFSISELELLTNGFANENIVMEEGEKKVYKGIYQDTPVLIRLFAATDDRFWSLLKILSRVRHRNILNLVGYCCTDASLFLLCDYPCNGTCKGCMLKTETALFSCPF